VGDKLTPCVQYCEAVAHGVDPFKALVCMANMSVVLLSFELALGEQRPDVIAQLLLMCIATPLCVTCLEQSVSYCELLQEVNARQKQRPEMALQYGMCLLVLLSTISPTCVHAVSHGGVLGAGALTCVALLYIAHARVWRWVDDRTSYVRVHVATCAALTAAKAVLYASLGGLAPP
jgi:hypothetical protein